jgi:Mrp family chromosome partitioning ATPase
VSWRVVLGFGLLGLALGFGWGIADRPLYRATAGVAVESDSQGSDQARLERFAQRGESRRVASAAAGLLGADVAAADLLADVTVAPAADGGALVVSAESESPDYAAAAAEGWALALVKVEGDPLAAGAAAEIPTAPYENRSAALWSAFGLAAGLIFGGLVAGALAIGGARRPAGEAPEPADPDRRSSSLPMDDLEADDHPHPVVTPEPGPRGPELAPGPGVVPGRGPGSTPPLLGSLSSGITPVAIGEDGSLALDRTLGDLRPVAAALAFAPGGRPRTLAVASVGDDDAGARIGIGLAFLAADTGIRVLLVEADFDAPLVADMLGIVPDPGLGDYLVGDAAPREVVRSVRVTPGAADATIDLTCVPAGGTGGEASVIGPRFAGLLERLSRVYELVIYLTPPAATDEAAAVTRLVDSTVLAAGAEVSTEETLGAVRSLEEGAAIDGLIRCEA